MSPISSHVYVPRHVLLQLMGSSSHESSGEGDGVCIPHLEVSQHAVHVSARVSHGSREQPVTASPSVHTYGSAGSHCSLAHSSAVQGRHSSM